MKMSSFQSGLRAALLLLLASSPALARTRPELDLFLASEVDLPLVAEHTLTPDTRARVELGQVAHMERRLGVPTFFWTGRTAHSPSWREVGLTPEQAARRYLYDYAELYRFSPSELAEARLSRVHDLGEGVVIVSFEREVNGVPVFRDSLRVAMNQRLEAVALTGYLTPGALSPARQPPAFSITAQAAIAEAFLDLTGARVLPTTLLPGPRQDGGWQWFPADSFVAADGSSFTRPARARRVLYPLPEGMEPAYHLELQVADPSRPGQSDFYAYVVSARDGALLSRHTLTAADSFNYRVWADPTTKMVHDGPQGLEGTPHPTGTPDGFRAPYIAPSLVSLQNFPFSKNDPWLAPGATVTKGNNTHAYADIDQVDGFSAGDRQPTTTAANTFDRVYDTLVAPKTPASQSLASATQLFYAINFLHDWYYDSGFDEASLNAQEDNYGRGGQGKDALLAEAQDASDTNNANMGTPSDGSSPVMQMFLWTGAAGRALKITAPAGAAKDLAAGVASFTPSTFNLSGALALGADATAPTTDGCQSLGSGTLTGKIVLLDAAGSTCAIGTQVTNAAAAGAVGLLIAQKTTGGPADLTGTGNGTLPVLGISLGDGAALRAAAATQTLTLAMTKTATVQRDGTLDMGIVAHEWGHYISNRLVGNASGLAGNQAYGMGEGMGDFHALMLVVREGDNLAPANANWNGTYSVANYAMTDVQTYYYGIRRLPYSTNMVKNGFTFKHIGNGAALPAGAIPLGSNAEPHNTGEIWATMGWECYASLLRAPRLTFQEAQRRMKQYWIAMYKLAPMTPTMLEMRDALLAATAARDANDFELFTQAFAKRGAGILAKGPDRASTTNTPVTESFITGGDLAYVKAELSDDVSSCDKDGQLDNKESGTLKLTVKNTGWTTLSAITGTVTTPTAGVTLAGGGTVTFPPVKPYDSTTTTLLVDAAGLTDIAKVPFNLTFTDPGLATPGSRTGSTTLRLNFDVVPMAAATDDVDGPVSVWTPGADPLLSTAFPWKRNAIGALQNVWFGQDVPVPASNYLVSPPLKVGTGSFGFTFRHRYSFEFVASGPNAGNYDGGVLELSTDNGATWADIGSKASPTYNGSVATATANPLTGKNGYVRQSTGYPNFVPVTVNLGTQYSGQTVLVRFRVGTDDGGADVGWEVDDFVFTGLTNLPFPKLVRDPNSCTNRAPIANAGADQEVQSGAVVTLNGSLSSDPDGDPLTFTWAQTGGPMVTLNGATFTAPAVTQDTTLTFTLVVSDGKVMSPPATTHVLVRSTAPTNRAPLANAGADQAVPSGATASLDGSGTDPDGDPLTFLWAQTEGPTAVLSSTTVAKPSFSVPAANPGTVLRFSLTVNDGRLNSAPSFVSIIVAPGGVGPDGGMLPDGGTKPDGGTIPTVDAGTTPDGGTGPGGTPKGCGCGQGGLAVAPFALLGLALLRRRRR